MAFKRIIGMTVAIAMSVGMLIGCGSNESATNTTSSAGTSTAQASATATPTPEEVTLTMWVTQAQQEGVALEREKAFLEKYPYIKLNKVLTTEGMNYLTSYAAGNAPDFLGVGQPQMSSYIYAGVAQPLDDYLNSWDEMQYMRKDMFENFAVGGKHYAVPQDSYVMVLNYNKKIFAEAGLNPPTTWDELLETAKKLTVPEKNQWGFNLLISQWTEWWFEYFVWQAGGDLTTENPDGTMKLTFTDPAVAKSIDFYRKLIDAKCIQPDITLDYTKMQQEFAAGHAAMTLNGSDSVVQYVNSGMKPEDVGYAPLPIGPSGKEVTQMGGSCFFITSGISKEKTDAAWKWISNYMSKEEVMRSNADRISKGSLPPLLRIRTDMPELVKSVDPALQAVVDKAEKNARLEFYGKGTVGAYIDKAVQKTALDPKSDIIKVFQEQQDLAQKEAADKFNADVLASKK